MSVDNGFYDRIADGWWDETGPMYALHPRANPARLEYALGVLRRACPPGARVLDLGCGGGFLSEELAGRGYAVRGLDPAGRLVEAAREHARRGGLEIDYRVGAGEALPYEPASSDAVLCLDVLEHVSDLDRVVAEVARVLAPGGVFVYDTINRTWKSRLVVVHLLQDLPWTSLAPKGLHDWRAFVRPGELRAVMARHGLAHRETVGLGPAENLLGLVRLLRRYKRGEITPAETFRRAGVQLGRDTSISYAGYAVRAPGPL